MPFVDYPFNFERPFIVIEVENPLNKSKAQIFALVDTGADSSLFPKSIAAMLGIDLKNTTDIEHTTGVENNKIATYKHPCIIRLLNPKDRKTVIKEMRECPIAFSDKETPPLLGTNNFLKYFTLTVAYGSKNTRLVY